MNHDLLTADTPSDPPREGVLFPESPAGSGVLKLSIHRRLDRAYTRMLAAKSWNWEMAWGDAFVSLVRLHRWRG